MEHATGRSVDRPSWRRSLPPVLCAGIVVGVVLLVDSAPGHLVAVLGLYAALLVLLRVTTRRTETSWLDVVPVVLFLVVLLVAFDATGGGHSDLTPLVVLALLWAALFGTRGHVYVVSAVAGLVFLAPIAVLGAPRYPADDAFRGVLWLVTSLVVAPAVQHVVERWRSDRELHRRLAEHLAEANARWQAVMDNLPDTTVFTLDERLEITTVAGAGATRTVFADAAGKRLPDVARPENVAIVKDLIRRARAGELAGADIAASDTGRVQEVVVREIHAAAHPELLLLARDVSHQRAREDALTTARDQATRLFVDAPQGVAVLDRSGTIRQANPALCALLGLAEADVLDRPLGTFSAAGSHSELIDHLEQVIAHPDRPTRRTWVLRTAADSERTVTLSSTLLHARSEHDEDAILTYLSDVTEERRYHEELTYLADHDPLTGLANRRKFERELDRHVQHCRRYGSRGAVLLLDLDHFKEVNDTLGHATGDELLIDLGIVFRQRIRSTDLLARLGGDEFAVLLTEADRADAEKVAGDLVAEVAAEMSRATDIRRLVTVSVGGVVVHAEDPRNILSTVDMMLYEAKDAGRNQFSVLDLRDAAGPPAGSRVRWTDRIEAALAEDRFELHLQPILDLRAGEVRGAEALLRMREGGGLVMPGEFLAVAERSSLIVEIDRWVIRRGATLLAELQAARPDFTLQLNISGRTLGNEAIVDELRRALAARPVVPAGLVLEVTETAAITHMRQARQLVEQIAALGCRLALDDFGAGFGSLYYLRHLPFDLVKIDGEFVEGAVTSTVDRTLIEAVVTMAAGLGQQTIAEYVSTYDRLRTVADLGVDFAQGAFIGMPIPVHDFLATLAAPPPAWRDVPGEHFEPTLGRPDDT